MKRKKLHQQIEDAIKTFCRNEAFDIDEAEDLIESFDWTIIDNLSAGSFKPVFAMQANGDYFLAHNYDHAPLFNGKRALNIDDSLVMFTSETIAVCELVEAWLLEDMTIQVTNTFRVVIENLEGDYIINYRYPVRDSFNEVAGDFDVSCFLDNLTRICEDEFC